MNLELGVSTNDTFVDYKIKVGKYVHINEG